MEKPVSIHDGMATFACPKCKKEKTADVSKYRNTIEIINVRCKCPCGHSFTVFLDRRSSERKEVMIRGMYILMYNDREINRDSMMVMNISRTGVQLKLFKEKQVQIGDRLIVKFSLDNAEKTTIQKEVKVNRIEDLMVGAEFFSPLETDEIPLL